MFLFFFYMLNLERSIVRIILLHRCWMSRDFEDLSEELYRFNKMNQMCQVIKLWSNAELTVEKTQEHIKGLGYRKTRRGRDRGYWKVSVVRFEWGGISFSFQRHSHCFPRYTQTAAAASNPVHFPRVRCDDSSWSWLMLACHVCVKCAYCLESKQQDVAQVLSHRFAFSCLRFSVTYSCLSRGREHEVALQQNHHNTVIKTLS